MSENAVIGTGSCWFGRTCREGCDKYKDGKCTGIMHPTYPPKMADCPFAGGESCVKLDYASRSVLEESSALDKAYETIFHLAKAIAGGRIDRLQMVRMANAMLSACRAYIDSDAADLCCRNPENPAEGYREDNGWDRYCPSRQDHLCRHPNRDCSYCGESIFMTNRAVEAKEDNQ